MTLVTDQACSATEALTSDVDVPDQWWTDLRAAQDTGESWGVTMAGYDVATLYVLALRAPDTATKLHDTFADIVDSPDGRRAQLLVISRYPRRGDNAGEFMDYADDLHRHARTLLDSAG